MEKIKFSKDEIEYVLSSKAVRERTEQIYNLSLEGKTNFKLNLEKMDDLAGFVLDVTKANYPDLDIPFHSRWGHFNAGEIDRVSVLQDKITHLDKLEQARCKLDLAIVSVLLDAGAGKEWKFKSSDCEDKIGRSEGLALASFFMFMNGDFSSDSSNPYRVDAQKLRELKIEDLERGFQISKENPLVGVEGRLGLLNSLADTLEEKKKFFKDARPGNIIDHLIDRLEDDEKITAPMILKAVLKGLGNIWPSRLVLGGNPLGDTWVYSSLGKTNSTSCLVPFHKLSQWLSYSLIGPIEEAGYPVSRVQDLTGLAEYRNGGLFFDFGLIEFRNPQLVQNEFSPSDDVIIEWRALTVSLLDKLATEVRAKLKKSEVDFPLAKVLEGGTWHAGRKLAFEKRAGGTPPIKINSDGTVF